jgi:hypothetical protein
MMTTGKFCVDERGGDQAGLETRMTNNGNNWNDPEVTGTFIPDFHIPVLTCEDQGDLFR